MSTVSPEHNVEKIKIPPHLLRPIGPRKQNTKWAFGRVFENFCNKLADGTYQVSAAWQSGLTNGALVGELIGLLINRIIVERFGYKKSVIGSLITYVAFVFIIFFAKTLPTITTTYASEVCPVVLRPYVTTYVNLCWGVLKAMSSRTDDWGYKILFALQWMWPVPIMIGVAFAPESPSWLVRKGRIEDARHALKRLTVPGQDPNFNVDETIAMIRSTNELEKKISAGTSYRDCFTGIDLVAQRLCLAIRFF
ncbi:General alpha-glucoside permease [Penicillium sp. IBT 16267x]|nr:General alpha-glucoside permease [Penicillium sp. IBT 16267x]